MPPVKIGINGFGRIGRLVARAALSKPDLVEIVAVNDPFLDTHYASYQFQYDSTHGKWPSTVTYDKEHIIIDGKKVRVFNEKDPENMSVDERRGRGQRVRRCCAAFHLCRECRFLRFVNSFSSRSLCVLVRGALSVSSMCASLLVSSSTRRVLRST
jgi:hypothetical protein